ncbi:STAS domain-containing protein [Rhodococcus sp. NPDC003322]
MSGARVLHLLLSLSDPTTGSTTRRQTPANGTPVVRVADDVDAASIDSFTVLLNDGLSAARHALIVDLSHNRFLSITACFILADAQWRAGYDGVEVALVAPDRQVRRALAATGILQRFRIFDTVDRARGATAVAPVGSAVCL